jgi:hypothetical protein
MYQPSQEELDLWMVVKMLIGCGLIFVIALAYFIFYPAVISIFNTLQGDIPLPYLSQGAAQFSAYSLYFSAAIIILFCGGIFVWLILPAVRNF